MAKKPTNFEELFFQILSNVVDELRGDLNDLRKTTQDGLHRIQTRLDNLENVKARVMDKGQLWRLALIALIMFLVIIGAVVGAKIPEVAL